MIKFEPGTVYDVAHLRPFDLELAKAGHPLATTLGEQVRCFRLTRADLAAYDYWHRSAERWIVSEELFAHNSEDLRLAPLAIRDGRPLHVGDEIETYCVLRCIAPGVREWRRAKADLQTIEPLTEWRWPKSKE